MTTKNLWRIPINKVKLNKNIFQVKEVPILTDLSLIENPQIFLNKIKQNKLKKVISIAKLTRIVYREKVPFIDLDLEQS